MSPRTQGRWGQGGLSGPPWLTLSAVAGLLLLYGLFGPAQETLLFERERILAGDLWRLATGHLVHADPAHLLWNLAALLVLGLSYELLHRPSPAAYFGLLAAGMLAVDGWLLWLEPHWSRYCGLSGALNALYGALAVAIWRETRSPIAILMIAGGLAKIAAEAAQGAALLPTSTWASVPGAHLAGLVAGLAASCRWGFAERVGAMIARDTIGPARCRSASPGSPRQTS